MALIKFTLEVPNAAGTMVMQADEDAAVRVPGGTMRAGDVQVNDKVCMSEGCKGFRVSAVEPA